MDNYTFINELLDIFQKYASLNLVGYDSEGKLDMISKFLQNKEDSVVNKKRRGDRKEFYDLIDEIVTTFENKNNDYAGVDKDMMANFYGCQNWGIDPLHGLVTRWSDKISRTQNLMRTGEQHVKDESLIDTFKDTAVYAMIIVIQLRRMQKANENG